MQHNWSRGLVRNIHNVITCLFCSPLLCFVFSLHKIRKLMHHLEVFLPICMFHLQNYSADSNEMKYFTFKPEVWGNFFCCFFNPILILLSTNFKSVTDNLWHIKCYTLCLWEWSDNKLMLSVLGKGRIVHAHNLSITPWKSKRKWR